MKKQRIVIGLVIFIILSAFIRCDVCAADADEIDNLIRQYQKNTKCKNVSVIVYSQGEVSFYGDSGNLYQIGSMTKAFTGLAVQKLIDEGLVREDDLISDYIPGFEAYYESEQVDISIRNLLEQKSGYTNNEKEYPAASELMSLSDWAESISGLTLSSRPGTEYAYSNVNYNLLGLIIEKVSGKTYRSYMEDEILIPLGLRNTYVGMPEDGRTVEGTRLGYRYVYDFPITVKEASIPAGYFYSNAEDMSHWIAMWTGNSDIPENFKNSISGVKEKLKKEEDYYSGWERFSGGVIGHSGGTPNYSSRVVFDEQKRIGVCVLSNLNVAASTDSLCNSIYDIQSGSSPRGLVADIWTIFDKVFTGVSLLGIIILIGIHFIKRNAVLITSDIVLILLLAMMLILFPNIFGAGIHEIMFKWAPWSLTGGFLIIVVDAVYVTVKLLMGRKYADYKETSEGQTADGDN